MSKIFYRNIFYLKIFNHDVSVWYDDGCELAQNYSGLEEEVEFLRLHQLLLLHLCRIIDVFEVLVAKIEDLAYWDKIKGIWTLMNHQIVK